MGLQVTSHGSRSTPPGEPKPGFIRELKLLFAALAAGGRVVPMGDNGRTARLLSEYASSLRGH